MVFVSCRRAKAYDILKLKPSPSINLWKRSVERYCTLRWIARTTLGLLFSLSKVTCAEIRN